MSAELIGILSVGVALAALIAGLAGLILSGHREMTRQLADVDRRLARVEGLIEGRGAPIPAPATGS